MNDHFDPLVLPLIDTTATASTVSPSTVPAPVAAKTAAEEPKPSVPSVPVEPPAPVAPLVVVAPVTTGRSFILRSFYNTQLRIGQMLVKISRAMPDAVIEVLEAFFPEVKPEKASDRGFERFFLGNLKVDSEDYWVLIFELRAEVVRGGFPKLQYRMLHPSGRVFRPWDRLDLSVLKLRTTEAQRAGISAMTGIIYKAPQEDVPKQVFEASRPPKRHPEGPRPQFKPGSQMNRLFNRAGITASHVKQQLKPTHDQIRDNLQRGLPTPKAPAAIPAARPHPDQLAIAEIAAKAGGPVQEAAGVASAVVGSPIPSGATESVVEIQTTLVTTAPQPAAPRGEGDSAEADASGVKPEVVAAGAGGSVAADGVGA